MGLGTRRALAFTSIYRHKVEGGELQGLVVHVQLDEGGVWFRVVVAKCIHGIKFEGPLLPHDCHLHVINAMKWNM